MERKRPRVRKAGGHRTAPRGVISATARARAPAPKGAPLDKIRILIADDQPIDRKGMAALLQSIPGFEIVAESSHALDAVIRCRELSPSIVILALRMRAPEGRTALSVIREGSPNTPVLALAERGEGHCLVLNPPRVGERPSGDHGAGCVTGTDCLQLAVTEGATGTIRRSAQPEELFRAVRAVASGSAWYESGTAASIMRHALAAQGRGKQPLLSERELEVAQLIGDGRSNKEISQGLGISEPTVKKHVGHILGKLNLQDRLQIGLYVARNPLLLGWQGT